MIVIAECHSMRLAQFTALVEDVHPVHQVVIGLAASIIDPRADDKFLTGRSRVRYRLFPGVREIFFGAVPMRIPEKGVPADHLQSKAIQQGLEILWRIAIKFTVTITGVLYI